MKTNYIIATYEGKGKRKHLYPPIDQVLNIHLEKILKLKNNLSQITIMKPYCNKAKIENYYTNMNNTIKKFDIPVEIINCENFGYSNGQWLKAYEKYKDKFDFYIFIEDDYCPNIDNFDKILIDIHKEKFPNNIGLLCSLVEGHKDYKNRGCYPIHYEGVISLSRETLKKLYSFEKWKGNPREYLDLIDKTIDSGYGWENIKRGYPGGYYQLTMSHLFTLAGINHDDYLGGKYQFPYWDDDGGEKIWFYEKGDIIRKEFSMEDIINSLIVPIQLSKKEYIYQNTNLKEKK